MSEVIYLTFDQATDLVYRIAKRCERFSYYMSEPEKEAMSQLLSDIGVNVNDIIDLSNLADNYAINAEIVTPDDVKNYDRSSLRDALFTWNFEGEKYYCLTW